MHRLDGHINDIEPRIKDICKHIPVEAELSLQLSLVAYGWILLDSWIGWRTLRFLLRKTYIDESVNEKWYRAPSSYTASQIKAVWNFDESAQKFIERNTGKSLKELFDGTIQMKRNSSAHFSRQNVINGTDYQTISQIFKCLSTVFLFYETVSFLEDIVSSLEKKGYNTFLISYPTSEHYAVGDLLSSIDIYSRSKQFELLFHDGMNVELSLLFQEDGCFFKKKDFSKAIYNEECNRYSFFENKGYYLNIERFIDSLDKIIWEANELGLEK